MNRDTITFAQTSYHERVPQTLECVRRLAPYVDRIVIVENDYTNEDKLKVQYPDNPEVTKNLPPESKVTLVHKDWLDCFSCFRNRYLNEVKDGWILVSDPDEWFSEEACKGLRDLVKHSELGSRYNVVAFNALDTYYADDVDWSKPDPAKVLSSNRSETWYKQLFFKRYDGMHYTGIVHEQLNWPFMLEPRAINAPPEMYYEHVKTNMEQRERGCRNLFQGGGGVNDQGKTWLGYVELKKWCHEHSMDTWNQFHAYLKKGNIDPWLADFIIQHRNWNEADWMGSEIRGLFYYYFVRLHPEENPTGIKSDFKE